MENRCFYDLYQQVTRVRVADCPPAALSSLLHGYLSVYSMVRVHPWLEEQYGTSWEIHERVREIAGVLSGLVNDDTIELDARIGHVADLMDTYQIYSDMEFLDVALDAAYGILSPEGCNEIVLPCRTLNVCRMLCDCYYFTGEEECAGLAREIMKEWTARVENDRDGWSGASAWEWCRLMEFYESTVGDDHDHVAGWSRKDVDELKQKVAGMVMGEDEGDLDARVFCFDVLAVREYEKKKYSN